MKLIGSAGETEVIAAAQASNNGVYMIPALTGLGAALGPNARGAIYGITRDLVRPISRAALESVAYQTDDLFTAIAGDGIPVSVVRVDGGMTANDWLMQFLADIVDLPVERPVGARRGAWRGDALMQSDPSITLHDPAARWQRRQLRAINGKQRRNDLVSEWNLAMKRTLTEG